jgi:hypothetical protein
MKKSHQYTITDPALRWLEVILAERFGQAWSLTRVGEGLRLQLVKSEGSILFDRLGSGFTQAHSEQPFTLCDVSAEGWNTILGKSLPAPGMINSPEKIIEARENAHIIHYDIIGLTYWMLARVEEIGRTDLDKHERFPATSSHAYKHGYLDRPVVDEWLDVLGQVIKRQWPGLQLKRHEFQMRISHDVDEPSLYAFKQWKTIARMMAGHILNRGDLKGFLTAPYVKITTSDYLIDADPYNTFDWIMDVSEANSIKSSFYFICGRTDPSKDADYELEHQVIRNLLLRIHSRGHEIGLHPSYNTFRDCDALKHEADRLKSICAEEGIKQDQLGGRMHYLRWAQPYTMRALADAGIIYDSTLGYADHAGFRCGTCHEYFTFDAVRQEQLSLRIRPLIAMECTVIDEPYMGLGSGQEAQEVFLNLKETCRHVKGCFSMLWHNSYLNTDNLKSTYISLLNN